MENTKFEWYTKNGDGACGTVIASNKDEATQKAVIDLYGVNSHPKDIVYEWIGNQGVPVYKDETITVKPLS